MPPHPMGAMPPQGPPPGMVPMVYQAYPGGPQQVYYVPAAAAAPQHVQSGFLEGMRSKIRSLSSTDALEGFSLKEMFKQVFTRHGTDAVEEYIMVGTSRTTPPLDQVETGWPKPWMFFRAAGILGSRFVGLAILFHFTMNEKTVPAILFLGAFAVPLSTLVLIFEMNTPRNVSLVMVGKLFVVGGLTGVMHGNAGLYGPDCRKHAGHRGGIGEAAGGSAGGAERALQIRAERNPLWGDGGRGICMLLRRAATDSTRSWRL